MKDPPRDRGRVKRLRQGATIPLHYNRRGLGKGRRERFGVRLPSIISTNAEHLGRHLSSLGDWSRGGLEEAKEVHNASVA